MMSWTGHTGWLPSPLSHFVLAFSRHAQAAARKGETHHLPDMARNGRSRCVYALAWALACVGHGPAASAQTGSDGRLGEAMSFDIPSMPLPAALERYSAVTGYSLLYDSTIMAGQRSAPVRGVFMPDAALRALIAGAGLQARYTAAHAFVLMPDAPAASRPAAGRRSSADADQAQARRRYYGRIQARMAGVFCRHPDTMPGGYRAAVRVWLDGEGAVQSLRLLDSTGQAERDARIVGSLQGARFGVPPAGVRQPITLLVLPRQAADTGDCAEGTGHG